MTHDDDEKAITCRFFTRHRERLCKVRDGYRFSPGQYRSWQWMVSSLDQAKNHERCRNNRSKPHGRWWYLGLTRWNRGTNQQLRRSSRSSWCSQPSRCIDGQQLPCRHQHPNEYGRNPMGRRSKEMWLQRHHRIPSYLRSNARTVSSDQHLPRRFVCRRLWRRSWELELGSIWWHWPSFLSRKHRSLVPLEYGRNNRWYLKNMSDINLKFIVEVKFFSEKYLQKLPSLEWRFNRLLQHFNSKLITSLSLFSIGWKVYQLRNRENYRTKKMCHMMEKGNSAIHTIGLALKV